MTDAKSFPPGPGPDRTSPAGTSPAGTSPDRTDAAGTSPERTCVVGTGPGGITDGAGPDGTTGGPAALAREGFVVLTGLLTARQLTAARGHADDLLTGVAWSDNDFDGRRTRRVYNLLGRPGALAPLMTHPTVHHLVAARLGPAYHVGMLFLAAVDPGQGAQSVHFDAGVYPLPPEVEAETNVIWALDDFTVDNGATLVAPGSHRWAPGRRPTPDELVPVLMPAGSAVVYSGRLWHAAGQNRSSTTRRALICEHLLPWLRPADNHLLAAAPEELRSLSPELRRLAGLTSATPYFGFVGGRSPEEWLHDG